MKSYKSEIKILTYTSVGWLNWALNNLAQESSVVTIACGPSRLPETEHEVISWNLPTFDI